MSAVRARSAMSVAVTDHSVPRMPFLTSPPCFCMGSTAKNIGIQAKSAILLIIPLSHQFCVFSYNMLRNFWHDRTLFVLQKWIVWKVYRFIEYHLTIFSASLRSKCKFSGAIAICLLPSLFPPFMAGRSPLKRGFSPLGSIHWYQYNSAKRTICRTIVLSFLSRDFRNKDSAIIEIEIVKKAFYLSADRKDNSISCRSCFLCLYYYSRYRKVRDKKDKSSSWNLSAWCALIYIPTQQHTDSDRISSWKNRCVFLLCSSYSAPGWIASRNSLFRWSNTPWEHWIVAIISSSGSITAKLKSYPAFRISCVKKMRCVLPFPSRKGWSILVTS